MCRYFFYTRDFYFWTLSCFLFIILASGLDTVSQCSGTESMSDWRRILRTEDIKYVAFHPILRTAPPLSYLLASGPHHGSAYL